MSILENIYHNEYYPGEPEDELPPALQGVKQEFFHEVEKVMGEKFVAQHWENIVEADQQCAFISFREGFRLGVGLMIEAMAGKV